MTNEHRSALLTELLAHFATWQEGNTQIMQTLYSCVYLRDSAFYKDDAVVAPFIKGMLYIINCYHKRAIYSNVLRDEDVSFPP